MPISINGSLIHPILLLASCWELCFISFYLVSCPSNTSFFFLSLSFVNFLSIFICLITHQTFPLTTFYQLKGFRFPKIQYYLWFFIWIFGNDTVYYLKFFKVISCSFNTNRIWVVIFHLADRSPIISKYFFSIQKIMLIRKIIESYT